MVDLPGLSMSLKAISKAWKGCMRCGLSVSRTKVIFGERFGTPDPDAWTPLILVIGDPPTREDDELGAFAGEAGKALRNDYLALGGVEFAFLTNIVACHPGGRHARKSEKDTCALRLIALIEHLQPDGIVTLGNVSYSQLCNLQLDGRLDEPVPVCAVLRPEFVLKQRGPKKAKALKSQARRIQLLVNHLRDKAAGTLSTVPRLHPMVGGPPAS